MEEQNNNAPGLSDSELTQAPESQPVAKSWTDRISFYILIALVFLLPFAFLPSLSLQFGKISLSILLTSALFIIACIAILKRGSIFLPKKAFLIAAIAVAAVAALSSLFSGSIGVSFFGTTFEIGTAFSVIVGVALLFLVSRILRTKEQIFSLYIAFFVSFFIVAIFQLIRLVGGPSLLSFGIFTAATDTIIGKWNELAIFFGLSTLLSLVTLESLKLSKLFRAIAWIGLIVSLFFIVLINYLYVEIALAVLSLFLLIYFYRAKKKMPIASLVMLILAIAFVLFNFYGTAIQAHLPAKLNIDQAEVSPSLSQTLLIAGHSIKKDPAFGVGPNLFQNEWLIYRPASVLQSIFWNVDFSSGFGLLFTYIATSGILGALAWLAFLVLFLLLGWKAILKEPGNVTARYLTLSSFFAALYLWIFNIFYTPTGTTYIMTFVFTGVFIASLYEEGKIGGTTIAYSKNRRSGFLTVFIVVIALIASVSVLVITIEKIAAAWYANSAVTAYNVKNDSAAAETDLRKALLLDHQPTYYQSLAQLEMADINSLLSQQNSQLATSTLQAQSQADWADALKNANAAIQADPKNYQSYYLLGDMYEDVFQYGDTAAYSLAASAYQSALAIDPTNPQILLSLAQLEITDKNPTSAIAYITKALQMKPNYTQALYAAVQIQANQNDLTDAIQTVTVITKLTPTDPTAFYELGYLQYLGKSYAEAIQSLTQAVSLESDYSNARYFLGLSYYQEGQTANAIAEFQAIQQLNPSNQDVAQILTNLEEGKAPITDETATSDQKASTQVLKNQPAKSHSAGSASSSVPASSASASAPASTGI